jgi:predicted TIM-barrel fold metal-dependent hydrolase
VEIGDLDDQHAAGQYTAVPDDELTDASRYTIVSVDGHAGAEISGYKPYLASRWHDEFDAWAAAYVNPFADLLAPTAYRNWDSDRRLSETESNGVVAEVLFPNTVPPFFAQGNLTALEPTRDDYERRFAGVQAHNRWLADFCAAAPGRRAGVAQVFLNDLDDTLAEIRWAKDNIDVCGGIMLPSVAPNSAIAPLWDPVYEPLWDLCEDLDIVLNVHAGSGLPDFGEHEAARAMMLIEIAWFAHRAVWHLIFGGVLERHPKLRIALTEQGTGWIPRGIETLDWFHRRMVHGGAAEAVFFGAVAKGMSLTPSEYFARNFWVGASFLRSSESALRYEVGVERIMWGADYPHSEGTYPYTTEALRVAFAGCPPEETRLMVESTPATVYGFDLEKLRAIGDRVGPTVADVRVPLDPADYPADSTCNAFDKDQVVKSW